MKAQSNSSFQHFLNPRLFKTVLLGAAIGLILITLFLLSAGEGDPSWSKLWRLRPLIITPLAGAGGGMFFYFMNFIKKGSGFGKAVAIIIGALGFLCALWLGSVLGLDGTYWN